MANVAVHLRISGVVQGVSYRASMARAAQEHGVRGWVRNASDGTVEAVLEGDEPSVKRTVDWARHGPPRAVVRRVEVKVVPVRNHRQFRVEA
jgi:acylphosphatase